MEEATIANVKSVLENSRLTNIVPEQKDMA